MKNYKPSADMPEPEVSKTFVTSRGISVPIKPVSQFKIDSLRMAKVEISPPTYRVSTVGGDEQEYPLDAVAAENKGRLDEWNAYLKEKQTAESGYAKKFLEMVIWEGAEIEVPGPDSDWQKTNDYFGIKVPDNAIERKLFYVYNELLGTPEDIGDLVSQIFAVSRIDEEAVKILRDSFRAGIRRKTNRSLPEAAGQVEDKKPDI
jgi:hypothetical protein